MAIYRKLAEIQSAVKAMTKDKEAYNYEYVTGDKVLNAIRPLMVNKGLLLLPSVKNVDTQVVGYDAWDKQAKAVVTKTEVLYVVYLEMKWVDSEDGETLIEQWAGSGMNAFDKGFGSALTYGERYYLLKTFHIATDRDDVDAIAADRDKALEEGYKAQVSHKAAPAPKKEEKPASISMDKYWKIVAAAAKGELTKSGVTMREWYIQNVRPDAAALAEFDAHVKDIQSMQ